MTALPDAARTAARRAGRGAAALAFAAWALIVVGALVRAHGAGLSCPDWPLCFGQLVPSFDLRIAFEYGHRVFAGTVTIGLLGLSLGLWRRAELGRRVRVPLAVACAPLGVQ